MLHRLDGATVLGDSQETGTSLIGITYVRAPRQSQRETSLHPAGGLLRKPTTWVVFSILTLLVVLTLAGAPYYLQGMATRVRSPLHDWFRSGGTIGQSLGILAFASFLFLWLYPIRKRVRILSRFGALPTWLRVHTMVGFFLPWVVVLHAGFRMNGLAGLAFFAMLVVWASGIIGRYLYRRIPRNQQGVELTLDQVASRRRELLLEISTFTGLSPQAIEDATLGRLAPSSNPGLVGTLRRFVADDWVLRQATRDLRRLAARSGRDVPRNPKAWHRIQDLTRQQVALEQHARLLEATRRIFRHWHAAHLPVGITALLAVIVHVVVVIAVGETWFR